MAFISNPLALAEPVPFTVAILITKSLVRSAVRSAVRMPDMMPSCSLPVSRRPATTYQPRSARQPRPDQSRLLHVPGSRRTALGTQPAVHAEIFVLGHEASGLLQCRGYEQRLRRLERRHAQARLQLLLVVRGGDGQAVHRADVDEGIALDAQLRLEDGLHVAVQAALCLLRGLLDA